MRSQCPLLGLPKHPVYLWTLPMFPLQRLVLPLDPGGHRRVSVCLRHVQAAAIYGALRGHKGEPFLRRPIVLNMLNNADPALKLGTRPPRQGDDGGGAARHRDRRHGGHGDRRDPCLWPHRNLWPLRGVRAQRNWQGQATALSRLKAARRGGLPLQGEMRVANPSAASRYPMDGRPWGR